MMANREFSTREKFSFQMMLEKPGKPLSKKIDDSLIQGDRKHISCSWKSADVQIYIEIKNGDKSVSIIDL